MVDNKAYSGPRMELIVAVQFVPYYGTTIGRLDGLAYKEYAKSKREPPGRQKVNISASQQKV